MFMASHSTANRKPILIAVALMALLLGLGLALRLGW